MTLSKSRKSKIRKRARRKTQRARTECETLPLLLSDRINNGIQQQQLIWRKEEIIKVTIHELFHLFNCDSKTIDTQSIIKLYQERYNINSTVINTFEAYTEIWANIINCFLLSGGDYKDFIHNLSRGN